MSSNDKEEILKLLKISLDDNNFPFYMIMCDSDEDCFYLADEWVISNVRSVYENIYEIYLW